MSKALLILRSSLFQTKNKLLLGERGREKEERNKAGKDCAEIHVDIIRRVNQFVLGLR